MRTFNKIILLGLVLISFIFTCSTFPCFTGTSASFSDAKYTSAEITADVWDTAANLVGLSDFNLLESGEELQRTAASVNETDYSPDNVSFSLNNGSSADNFTNNSSTAENETINLNKTVNLTEASENRGGSGSSGTTTDQDKNEDVLPEANFSSNISSGYVPLTVQFTDLSKNAVDWNWDFGDRASSSEQNPTHTYYTAGNYTETLTVSNANGTSSTFSAITILQPVLPIANFSSNITSGYVPLTVQFTDLSKNAVDWNWDFGDGASSSEQNPTHTYYTAGNYTETLTVSNAKGTNSTFSAITVLQPVLPIANFSSNITSGYAPLTVQFTDLSKNAAEWNWDFGDGASSSEQNPAHTYYTAGTYAVTLTASNADGQNIKTSEISVSKNSVDNTEDKNSSMEMGA